MHWLFLECSYGKYGVGCEMSCGHCTNKGLCHHVNGTCLGGCEQGYTGGFCICECYTSYWISWYAYS